MKRENGVCFTTANPFHNLAFAEWATLADLPRTHITRQQGWVYCEVSQEHAGPEVMQRISSMFLRSWRWKVSPKMARTSKPELRVKPRSYMPTVRELNEDLQIDATPEELARAALAQVTVVEDDAD